MHKISVLLFSTIITAAACGQSNGTTASPAKAQQGNGPVETQPPNSDYKPAFAGQTRIAGVKTKAAYEGKVLATGLKSPWGLTALPDGRLLITEKRGNMRIATAQANSANPSPASRK